jgi:hypothetical protein
MTATTGLPAIESTLATHHNPLKLRWPLKDASGCPAAPNLRQQVAVFRALS